MTLFSLSCKGLSTETILTIYHKIEKKPIGTFHNHKSKYTEPNSRFLLDNPFRVISSIQYTHDKVKLAKIT